LPFVGILAAALALVSYVPGVSTATVTSDIQKQRDNASGQVRFSSARPKEKDEKVPGQVVDTAERAYKSVAQPKLEALGVVYREVLRKAAKPGAYPYVSPINGGMVELDVELGADGAVTAVPSCVIKVGGKVTEEKVAADVCAALTPRIKEWNLGVELGKGPLAKSVLTLFLEPPRAPTEAWNLECVQQDTLSAKPCTGEEIALYGRDGRKPLPRPQAAVVEGPKADAGPPSGEDEDLEKAFGLVPEAGAKAVPDGGAEEDEDLEKAFGLTGDAGAKAPETKDAAAAPAPSSSSEFDEDDLEKQFGLKPNKK
jgi:hypothetical protein